MMPLFSKDHVEYLRSCTVNVECEGNSGTGFFVLPGLVISCLHVIHASATTRLRWNAAALTIEEVVSAPDPNIDLILFRVAEKNHPLLPLGTTEAASGDIVSYGYQ